jgi:sec-independent protein translocase protein TatA
MEILGVGMPELIFIFIIALIVLGPKDMQKAGKTVGKWLRGIVTSDGWKLFQQTSHEIRALPTRLMREANEELHQIGDSLKDVNAMRPPNPNEPARSQSIPNDKGAPPVNLETKESENGQEKDG